MKPCEVFRIIKRDTGEHQGSFSRACHDEYDFSSPENARNANVHGMFEDKRKFKIAKYRVTYELIQDDVDGKDMPKEWLEKEAKKKSDLKRFKEMFV